MADLGIMCKFAPSYIYILNLDNMETTIKKNREEVRAAFREMMRKKHERIQESRENLELMYQQGLFNY